MINVPAGDPKAVSAFYAGLLGIEFAPSLSDQVAGFHAPVSSDAIKLSIQHSGPSQTGVACIFAVDNLDEAITEAQRLGGRAVGSRFDLPIAASARDVYRRNMLRAGVKEAELTDNVGTAAVVVDPGGTALILVQLDPHAQYSFKTGAYHQGLSARQVAEHQQELAASAGLHLGPAAG